ncbi:hypothetical protein [Ferrimonas balearica]|uniref:hypothetical protein n=1 Tax=Ferrimonas balearica TaxID=44012 RepID=UPI001C58E333|nr:hypothetical protein [Ferrimonas balearica]MBW3139357.1 hypothetical protein [Ferrimonas balearica]MBW3163054.1 hypothetical protein [Ferrimonas balearica]MBY5980746.1 hypothetical protein [Ferrimonas balearica]MBY6222999.1 hypothetical protein [Ferrimonas balearica]
MKLNNLIKEEQRYLKRITIMTIAGLVLVVGIMVGPSIGNWTEDIVVVTGVVYGADYRPQSTAHQTKLWVMLDQEGRLVRAVVPIGRNIRVGNRVELHKQRLANGGTRYVFQKYID